MTVTSKTVPTAVIRKDEIVARIIMAMLSIGLMIGLWIIGAYFTSISVVAMATWFGVEFPTSYGQWLIIPVIFSIVEVVALAYRTKLPTAILAMAIGVGLLDFTTSVYGTAVVVSGKTIPLLVGYRVPTMYNDAGSPNVGPMIVGIIVAFLLTFAPEKVLLSAVGDILKAVRILRG